MADIELVIKIPENTYKDIIENGFIYDEDNEVVTHAIKNGTSLPKGHGKLFDENKIKEEAIKCEWSRLTYDMLDHMLSYMKSIIEADTESENK